MILEVRADGTHICGYVNAVERKSTPIVTKRGVVVEMIAPRAFERALERADDVILTVDHDKKPRASTADGTLQLYEDSIGLYADAIVSDQELIGAARAGNLKGWSFCFEALKDTLEPQDGQHPLRIVQDMKLLEVSLIRYNTPAYPATSVEVRPGFSHQRSLESYKRRADAVRRTDGTA